MLVALMAGPRTVAAEGTAALGDLLLPRGIITGGPGAMASTPPGVPPTAFPPAGRPPLGMPRPGIPPAGFPPAGVPPAGLPPQIRPAPQAFVKLQFPTAIAATAAAVFVVDSGLGALLRVDPLTHSVATLRTMPALPGVRLAAAPDGSLYVLRPERSEVQRLGRDGGTLTSALDLAEVPRPVALTTEANRNTLLVADASGEVYVFEALGGPGEALPGSKPAGGEGPRITLLAVGRTTAYGYDARCRCLWVVDRDEGLQPYGAPVELALPVAMIADDHDRLWIIDNGDRMLKVVNEAGEIARFSPAQLGMAELTAIAAHHQRLYLADGPTGRIAVFDILTPRGGVR